MVGERVGSTMYMIRGMNERRLFNMQKKNLSRNMIEILEGKRKKTCVAPEGRIKIRKW